jgi:hypothetical protein
MHVFLMSKIPLWNKRMKENSVNVKYLRDRWESITGDSSGVFLKPLYFVDADGREIEYEPKTGNVEVLDKAISECMKYTLKCDAQSLSGFSYDFINELVTTRNRYYGRTGCFSANSKASKQFAELERLCTDFADLEEVAERENRTLMNPETGEIHAKEETKLSVTYHGNTAPRTVALAELSNEELLMLHANRTLPDGSRVQLKPRKTESHYYTFKDKKAVSVYEWNEIKKASVHLGKSVRADYHEKNDITN